MAIDGGSKHTEGAQESVNQLHLPGGAPRESELTSCTQNGNPQGTPPHWSLRQPRWRLIRYGQWIVIPIAVALLCNRAALDVASRREGPYQTVAANPPAGHVDVAFVGDSRVAAVIDSGAFDRRMQSLTSRPFHSMNLGWAASTPAEHYLGIRSLLGKYPEHFRGTVFLVGAPQGLPSADTWKDPWYGHDGSEKSVIQLMRPEDMERLMASEPTPEGRWKMTEAAWEQHVPGIFYRKMVAHQLLTKTQWLSALAFSRAHLAPKGASDDIDNTPLSQYHILDHATEWRRSIEEHPDQYFRTDVGDWRHTILADTEALVSSHGASLALFDIPQDSAWQRLYLAPRQKGQRDAVKGFLAARKMPAVTRAAFPFTDQDFPDHLHLALGRRAEFSASLADAWYESQKNARMRTASRPASNAALKH
jgi:hypothetical protein